MEYRQIDSKISEVVLTDLSNFNPKKMEKYAKLDKERGIILSVMVDNLRNDPLRGSYESSRYNFQNFIEGRQFFHSQHGFQPYPPDTYLSENKRFVRSKIGEYELKLHENYKLLEKMNLDEYLTFLEKLSRQDHTSCRKKEMINEYLFEFTKFKNRKNYNLFSIASGNEFIAKGMYLFGILPTYFVRVV